MPGKCLGCDFEVVADRLRDLGGAQVLVGEDSFEPFPVLVVEGFDPAADGAHLGTSRCADVLGQTLEHALSMSGDEMDEQLIDELIGETEN